MSFRFFMVLLSASLLFLCLEPWGLQASYQPNEPLPPFESSIEIVAVGDIMMHLSQVRSAYNEKTQRFDFTSQFAEVRKQISAADIAIGNLETTFTPGRKASGYPRFNSPAELARDLRTTGFDLLVTANNHALDYGEKGVLGTLDALEKNHLTPVGTHRSAAEALRPVLVDKNDIKIAFLAYTCGTNGLQPPGKKSYLLSLFSEEKVVLDVAAAREAGADLILAYIHFGAEYERYPDPEQYRIAKAMSAAGVDVVLGSHPHVIQPANHRITENRYTLFSLGNFISGQRGKFTDVGLMLNLRITKKYPTGRTSIDRVTYTPTYVQRIKAGKGVAYSVVPLTQVDTQVSSSYRKRLTYNKTSLNSDVLGHIRGGVYLEMPEEKKLPAIP